MNVSMFGVVLFLHITVALAAFAMAGVGHASLQAVARAGTVAEARPWAKAMHRIEPLFPLAALVLLGLGAWLVHLGAKTDDHFSFKDGWILTAIIALVLIEAAGGAVLAPHGKKLNGLVLEAPDGPITPEIRAAATNVPFWHVIHLSTFGILGIVFLMATKPSGAWAPVIVVIGVVVGIGLSSWQLRALSATSGATTAGTTTTTAAEASP